MTDSFVLDGSANADGAGPQDAGPPKVKSSGGVVDWMKVNLFSSVGNSILTVLFTLVSLVVLRFIIRLIFQEETNWEAVGTNMRLLTTFNYPADSYWRVWVTVGGLLVMALISMAAFNARPSMNLRKLGTFIASVGALIMVSSLMGGWADVLENRSMFQSIVVGAVIFMPGVALMGISNSDEIDIPFEALLLAVGAFFMALLWLVPWGRHELVDGEIIHLPGTVNVSTKLPWTLVIGGAILAYFIFRALRPVIPERPWRSLMAIWWVAGPAFLIFYIWRGPVFDWDHVISTDIPMFLGFAVIGGAILYLLTSPTIGEKARLIAAGLLVLALSTFFFALFGFNWVEWLGGPDWAQTLFGLWPMLQKARLSLLLLALFALAAPTFAGEVRARVRFVGAWVLVIFLVQALITAINTPQGVKIGSGPILGGLALTLGIAYYTVLLSFPLGITLALARTSKMPIFRVLSTIYIELIRGIPLITVLFFFANMVPLFLPDGMSIAELGAVLLGYTLFSGAYMAENIRGGLQSIRKGQFEASDALGLTTGQRTAFIVLPQTLRVSIPQLVGQAIATFKETSLIAIIGGFDFLRVADKSIPAQSDFLGDKIPGLLFISLVYFIFAFGMSKYSQNLERKLAVGAR